MSFDVDRVRERLPGRRIDWFASTDSTMVQARTALTAGRIIVADEQTAGVGRQGRKWLSSPGEGLYVSMILGAQPVPVIMLALGLATQEAMMTVAGLHADLRWPNDVLINGRKCAGVLAQVESGVVIAGIGINVSQADFPDDLETPATSLLREGARVLREDLLIALVECVDRCSGFSADQTLRAFAEASSYVSGKRVRAGDVVGMTCGLDPAGFLRVREDNGTETTILAGGVRPA
ncbi:MAG: biotin--[acetyl-CoA-carboxylase] ligase [Acidobacteriota bacterium]